MFFAVPGRLDVAVAFILPPVSPPWTSAVNQDQMQLLMPRRELRQVSVRSSTSRERCQGTTASDSTVTEIHLFFPFVFSKIQKSAVCEGFVSCKIWVERDQICTKEDPKRTQS